MLKQLSQPTPGGGILKAIVDEYKLEEKKGFPSGPLSLTRCQELILSVSHIYPEITLIIDALDECNPQKRIDFFFSLGEIRQLAPCVRVFISSRRDRDITLHFQNTPNVSIRSRDNREDIERFLRNEINDSIERGKLLGGDITHSLKSEIMEKLEADANGMYVILNPLSAGIQLINELVYTIRFLWVSYQIQTLCTMDTPPDVRSMLGRLPMGLEKTYESIYQRILFKNPVKQGS